MYNESKYNDSDNKKYIVIETTKIQHCFRKVLIVSCVGNK